jgi:hypothetical protein
MEEFDPLCKLNARSSQHHPPEKQFFETSPQAKSTSVGTFPSLSEFERHNDKNPSDPFDEPSHTNGPDEEWNWYDTMDSPFAGSPITRSFGSQMNYHLETK